MGQGLAPASLGLDGSWRLGLTMAALQHMQFGHDIVFTFGPLGYVLAGVPAPALAAVTTYLTLMLVVVAVAGAWSACSGRSSPFMRAAFIGALIVTAASLSVDYVAFAGTLALLARQARFPRHAPIVAAIIGIVGAFGLLSKQTLGLDILACTGVFFAVAALVGPRRRRVSALLSLAGLAIVVVGLMLWAFGGSLAAVVTYLRNSAEIVAGYSAAMSSPGPVSVVAGGLAIGLAIAVCAAALAREGKAPFAAAVAVAVFLAWKHGFVREDGHVKYFFAVAPLLPTLMGIAARRVQTLAIAVIATLITFGGAASMMAEYDDSVVVLISPARIAAGADTILHPVAAARVAEAASRTVLEGDRLAPEVRAHIGNSTVDVIPAETAIVAVNGLRWMPPPVFQSYSAYTPRLDEIDRDVLATRGAEVELLRYEDIDLRYPLSSEPATFAELLCRYRPASWTVATPATGAFIALLRQPASRCSPEALGTSTGGLNRPIGIPRTRNPNDVVRAYFDLRLTALGALSGALWRPPFVNIEATFRDGTIRRWRLVAATAHDGVIVSPMPRSQDEARRLFAGDPLSDASVTSVRLLAREPFYTLGPVTFSALRR